LKYRHRDRANRAVPILCAIVLGGVDVAIVAGGPGLSGTVRFTIVGLLALAAVLVAAAVPKPERWGWLGLLVGLALLAAVPPARTVPDRLIFGSLVLAGLIGLMVWHARQKRTALWSRDS
jgi:hypothetical protein